MDHLVRMLRESFLFSDIPPEIIQDEILPRGRVQDIPKGGYLIHFQERLDSFGLIVQGKVNLLHIYGNGDYGIMGVLETGDYFGIDLMYTRSRISPYYAHATQATRILRFPVELILNRGSLSGQIRTMILERMLTELANENMRKEYRLAILFQKGLRDRIMTYLTMQANKRHCATFTVPFTRDEMASYLCVNRSCLSHELSQMEKEGVLSFSRNSFTLLDWEGCNGTEESHVMMP